MCLRLFCAALFAGVALASGVSSAEKETALWKTVGSWAVYIDSTVQFQCFITTIYEDNTVFRVGFQDPGSATALYVAIGNLDWVSIEEGKDYDLVLRIDNGAEWTSPARGLRFGPMPSLIIGTNQTDFVEQLMRRHSLQVYFRDRQILNLSLRGSNAAMIEMGACQNAVDAYLGANRQAQPSDPFAGVAAPTSKSDPFEF